MVQIRTHLCGGKEGERIKSVHKPNSHTPIPIYRFPYPDSHTLIPIHRFPYTDSHTPIPMYTHITPQELLKLCQTYNLLLVAPSAAVGGGQGRGADLGVPRHVVLLAGRAHRDGVGTHSVAVAVAAVTILPSIAGSPDKYRAKPLATLGREGEQWGI